MTVYENEPSSVVAFTLSSHDYKRQIKEKRKMRLGSSSVNPDEILYVESYFSVLYGYCLFNSKITVTI